ncbi:hypothetical protein MJO29_002447 [Puccinia striiformis f. sp. tritici]|nr:hypothetical protein Pst134EA_002432 [Puccinia striiformis f. sp. tritici]KAH9463996.1 hypothetical protein Pst134EB_003536 [Puccinia striiformis f. sp. tritici]KAH9471793.1 hypothetical protein Pst134EA_002432 [Puccinia striiformis f. sp. tritici]KAI7966699.1 hypothetical protein MJO29_002447 [Puccinia striiformis f. sp. tritici]
MEIRRLNPALKHRTQHDQGVSSPSLMKRGFFGNEAEMGVMTIRSQDRQQTTSLDGTASVPMVILPSGPPSTPPFVSATNADNDINHETGDANLSTGKKITGQLGAASEGTGASPATSEPQASSPPSIQDKGEVDPNRVVTSTPESHRNAEADFKNLDAQGLSSNKDVVKSHLNNANSPATQPPQLWMIVIFCVLLILAVLLCITLMKKRYQVSFKPFKISKKPRSVAHGKSANPGGQSTAASQASSRSNNSQMTQIPSDEKFTSSTEQKHHTFDSTLAELSPNPQSGAKRFPQRWPNPGTLSSRLRNFFGSKDSKSIISPESNPAREASNSNPNPENSTIPKPPLPEICLSQPDPVHPKDNITPDTKDQNMLDVTHTHRENHGLSISAMSPLKNSPMLMFNDHQTDSVELHCIRTDQIGIVY